eukprot:m.50778 g.50778  ORF g.50778 m.50778 type:complete len:234 (-) comp21345_c1_seq1:68-769(-)
MSSMSKSDSKTVCELVCEPVCTKRRKIQLCPEEKNISFSELKTKLSELLEEDKADCDLIREALNAYKTDVKDWEQFTNWDEHTYTRNLIDSGNGKYNLMLLCWNLGQASSIHDHAGSHCFMKCLDGGLREELYDCPEKLKEDEPMEPCAVNPLDTDGVCYISDQVGLHRISNPSHNVQAVSLHLYSPPYETCNSYSESTSTPRRCPKITFYSENGVVCANSDTSNPLGNETPH